MTRKTRMTPGKTCKRGFVLAFGLLLAAVSSSRADVLDEARQAQRRLEYDEARTLLEEALSNFEAPQRGQAYFLLASLSTDHKEARRLLREAQRAYPDAAMQRAADLELARLDFARGNYNSVRSRLDPYEDDEARLLLAQAWVALDEPTRAHEVLKRLPSSPREELLTSWALRAEGETDEALGRLRRLVQSSSDFLPTALLWKAECEVELGRFAEARETATALEQRYPDTPERTLLDPVLTALRDAPGDSPRPAPVVPEVPAPSTPRAESVASPEPGASSSGELQGAVVLQIGAFAERNNATRFRNTLPPELQPVRIDPIHSGNRTIYRVSIGPFESAAVAESYGRTRLEPLGIEWRVTRPESP